MGKRRQPRLKTILPVRIWGVDAEGKPFAQLAHTLDISHSGVRVGGVTAQPEPGAVVSLQCHHRKCNFTVAWIGKPGTARNNQLGLRNLEPERDIFDARLKGDTVVDDFVLPADSIDPNDRSAARRAPRFLTSGTASVRKTNSLEERLSKIQDVSISGAYLATPSPYTVGSVVGVTLRIDEETIQVFGTVRTCHPMLGMGIEFQRFYTEDDEAKLTAKMKAVAKEMPLAPPMSAPKPDSAAIAERLQKVTEELEEVHQLMQSGTVDAQVLAEFHDAASRVRTTAWALQKWMELQKQDKDPFPVLSFLNAERINLATKLCDSLHQELQRTEVKRQKIKLNGLLSAVEKLFTGLAGIDFTVVAPDEPPELEEPVKKKSAHHETKA